MVITMDYEQKNDLFISFFLSLSNTLEVWQLF